ncbi:MAG: hypothetical protein JNM27_16225 [Leptospirales bacterium]|nr:hypothetical protein [Leptospirales bacterium]
MYDRCSGFQEKALQQFDLIARDAGLFSARWARRIHRASRLPGFLGDVFILNCHTLREPTEKAPILAFSHKKIHDLFTVVELALARSFPMHGHTVIAQGGLFSGMYVYRDWVPLFFKRWPFRMFSEILSRFIGRKIESLLRGANCHPVYRRFRDVPSRKVYDSYVFSGKRISGMTYDQFTEYTRNETQKSIEAVRTNIQDKNKSLVIFPEGKYQQSGAIGKLNAFLMSVAQESGHPLLTLSITYDELCPDKRGRIDTFITVNRIENQDKLAKATTNSLQTNTAVTASNLLALILLEAGTQTEISSMESNLEKMSHALPALALPFDERLLDVNFRKDRIERMLAARKNWFKRSNNALKLVSSEMAKFQTSERTVNDLEWNKNNIQHAIPALMQILREPPAGNGSGQ